MMLAGRTQAQSPPEPLPEPEPSSAPASSANGDVTTLGEVRAIKPEDDQPLDLYRFKSPVQAAPNRFSRSWSEPPSPEQVGMSGGYVMKGIVYGIVKAAQGINKITGGPDQIQSAIARPPPALSEQQQRRALQFCDPQQGCVAPPQK
ncbi:hypothetical protein KQ945_10255 [Bacillus subtilis subsp. subtilis]|nr:hypothetical protein [Bacillus subtilis subsp. subtilis]